MARRRVTEPPPAKPPKVPARLAEGPFVEDWTTSADVPPPWWLDGPDRYRQIVAFRRWSEARRQWATEHHVDRARLAEVSPIRAPRSRPP